MLNWLAVPSMQTTRLRPFFSVGGGGHLHSYVLLSEGALCAEGSIGCMAEMSSESTARENGAGSGADRASLLSPSGMVGELESESDSMLRGEIEL